MKPTSGTSAAYWRRNLNENLAPHVSAVLFDDYFRCVEKSHTIFVSPLRKNAADVLRRAQAMTHWVWQLTEPSTEAASVDNESEDEEANYATPWNNAAARTASKHMDLDLRESLVIIATQPTLSRLLCGRQASAAQQSQPLA